MEALECWSPPRLGLGVGCTSVFTENIGKLGPYDVCTSPCRFQKFKN